MSVEEWITAYGRAWREKNAAAAAQLFAEQSIYRDDPFGQPYVGRDGVQTYWSGVTATQENVTVRFGNHIAADRHAAVEFWVTMVNGGAEVTLAGILFLRFDAAGLCEELREAWHFTEGRHEPPAGLGQLIDGRRGGLLQLTQRAQRSARSFLMARIELLAPSVCRRSTAHEHWHATLSGMASAYRRATPGADV